MHCNITDPLINNTTNNQNARQIQVKCGKGYWDPTLIDLPITIIMSVIN